MCCQETKQRQVDKSNIVAVHKGDAERPHLYHTKILMKTNDPANGYLVSAKYFKSVILDVMNREVLEVCISGLTEDLCPGNKDVARCMHSSVSCPDSGADQG